MKECNRAHVKVSFIDFKEKNEYNNTIGMVKVSCNKDRQNQFSFELKIFEKNGEILLGNPVLTLNRNFKNWLKQKGKNNEY